MRITLAGNHFILSPYKVIFWVEKRILFLADLHLTKENHFRKHGIAVPAGITAATLRKLKKVIQEFAPLEVLFLGDLFHSDENNGIHEFIEWEKNISGVPCKLIIGNHDVMHRNVYESMRIELLGEQKEVENVIFSHAPMEAQNDINFCGHLHPCITMYGKARQSLRLPCFYFNGRNFILPAFGEFTGAKSLHINKTDKIYAVADKEIIVIQ